MIVALFPELAAAGGVQRAGRLTAAALLEFASRRNETCTFLSLNDPPGLHHVGVGQHEITFAGFGRSKALFAFAAWNAAARDPIFAIALHPNLAPILAAMKIRSPATKTVVFAHGIEVWQPLGFVRRKSLARCDLVLAPSADTVRHLIGEQRVPPEKTARLPWSLGPEFPAQEEQRSASPRSSCPDGFPSGRIVLTVGRWDAAEAYKGVDHLIACLPRLVPDIPEVHLVAIGEGTDVPRLRQLAQASGVAGRVHFLPFQPPGKLQAAYDCCDVFALPSRGEGFGLVFLEAMSHGKPVIGGAHGGIPDVIEEGVSGFLVPYADVPTLTSRIRTLLLDDSAREKMGRAARARVLSDFTFPRFAEHLAERLAKLVPFP